MLTQAYEEEQKKLLDDQKIVQFFGAYPHVKEIFERQDAEKKTIFLQLILLGYEKRLLVEESVLNKLLKDLIPTHRFFGFEGGLLGYQKEIDQLLKEDFKTDQLTYHSYVGFDIRKESQEVKEAIREAILGLDKVAEMYAVGGAADRLNLFDPLTKKELPAACLKLEGRSLLEHLILDLKAKETLYFKLTGKTLTIPVALMTSNEKNNREEILKLLEENQWFSRPKDSFLFFNQPLVPVIDREGKWVFCEEGKLSLKPGGHGVIWKLSQDAGVLDELLRRKKEYVLIRQINNLVSGVDFGILAFMGYGMLKHKEFGFSSCERLIGTAEGMNVLIEKEKKGKKGFVLTNVEYCDFQKYHIEDAPKAPGSPYSKFPSNTNLLFAKIPAIQKAIAELPLPGKILNFKPVALAKNGKKEVARLETMMQNIADAFEEDSFELKRSYLCFNERKKTISTVKKQYQEGSSYLETPEACLYDRMLNAYDLLHHFLHFEVCKNASIEEFVQEPAFLFSYLPSLGPLYSIIAQKIQKGVLKKGSELRLECIEIDLKEIDLAGSLWIQGEGSCTLHNVRVKNTGAKKKENLHIQLAPNSEFWAENITFDGGMTIVVNAGEKVLAKQTKEGVVLEKEPLTAPWTWDYSFDSSHCIVLKKKR